MGGITTYLCSGSMSLMSPSTANMDVAVTSLLIKSGDINPFIQRRVRSRVLVYAFSLSTCLADMAAVCLDFMQLKLT
jgi:hypothetical protein